MLILVPQKPVEEESSAQAGNEPQEIGVTDLPRSRSPQEKADSVTEAVLEPDVTPEPKIPPPVPTLLPPVPAAAPEPVSEPEPEPEPAPEPEPEAEAEPELEPEAEPALEPEPEAEPEPKPESESEAEPEPELEPQPEPEPGAEITLEGGLLIPFAADFPELEGSTDGCFRLENCRRIENQGSPRQIGQRLEAKLEDLYDVTARDDLSESGYEVFELRKKDIPEAQVHYLSIFSDQLGSAVYTLTQEPIRLEDLRQLNDSG